MILFINKYTDEQLRKVTRYDIDPEPYYLIFLSPACRPNTPHNPYQAIAFSYPDYPQLYYGEKS